MSGQQPSTSLERGSATLLVVGAIASIMTLTTSALVLAAVIVATHQARSAADLAALAGAQRLEDAVAEDAACAEARRVAQRNRAQLRGCAVDGMDLEVIVAVTVRTWPSDAVARARAGPDQEMAVRSPP